MRFGKFGGHAAILGITLAVCAPLGTLSAAPRTHASQSAAHANTRAVVAGMNHARSGYAGRGYATVRYGRGGGLQCVPFARENSGIELSGNASTWWNNAQGVYARGAKPEVGSVLNFRANGRMRMGHVAVVTNVVDGRNIEIDHANWAGPGASRGGVSRNITVVDVSERNDWTAVRVALGHTGDYGSVYPTYGFIYDRADSGTMVANSGVAPALVLNAPPRDLRPAADRMQFAANQDVEEVAEAADDSTPRVRRAAHRVRGNAKATVTRVQARPAGRATAHTTHRHRT